MKHIVCLSTSNWYPFPTRKQNVMKRLSDAEVLYFDPPVSYIAPLKDKNARERLKKHQAPAEKPEENIEVFALPPVLPFFNKYRWINRLNQKKIARFVTKKLRQKGWSDAVLWCYSPTSCDAADHIPHTKLVYDCVDRHSAYPGHIDPAVVDRMEEDLARKADMVFATAEGLRERLAQFNQNVVMIPNGSNHPLFARVQTEHFERPEDMKEIPGTIYGFVGMLQDCICYDWLEALADRDPGNSLVFIGKPLPGVDISGLQSRKNVYFLGLKKQEELPAYMAHFDVCLNPFKENDLSRDVSPLKFYEYLSTGKPVVTAPVPLQVMEFANVVGVAHDREEFVNLCEDFGKEKDPEMERERSHLGAQCSWDARVRKMEEELAARDILPL